jgi:tetratricopeptide (TPR) repeat protein
MECERLCQTAIELAKAINTIDYLGWRYYDVSRISYYRGDFPTAQQWAQEARSVWQRQSYIKGICNAERILGLIALRSGNVEEAIQLINGSFLAYQTTGEEDNLAHYFGSMGELAEYQGDIAAAKGWYEQAIAALRARNNIIYLASDLLNLGRVSLLLGDQEEAHSYFSDSLQVARECGRVDMIARSCISLAQLEYDQRQLATAQANARQALDLFRRLGMQRDAEAAETLLATIGAALEAAE